MEDLYEEDIPEDAIIQTYVLSQPVRSNEMFKCTFWFSPRDLDGGIQGGERIRLPQTLFGCNEIDYDMNAEYEHALSKFSRYVIGKGMETKGNDEDLRFFRLMSRGELEKFPLISQQWLRCFNIPKWETRAEKS